MFFISQHPVAQAPLVVSRKIYMTSFFINKIPTVGIVFFKYFYSNLRLYMYIINRIFFEYLKKKKLCQYNFFYFFKKINSDGIISYNNYINTVSCLLPFNSKKNRIFKKALWFYSKKRWLQQKYYFLCIYLWTNIFDESNLAISVYFLKKLNTVDAFLYFFFKNKYFISQITYFWKNFYFFNFFYLVKNYFYFSHFNYFNFIQNNNSSLQQDLTYNNNSSILVKTLNRFRYGILYISYKRRFVGLTLTMQGYFNNSIEHTNFLASNKSLFQFELQTKDRVLLTISNTLIRALYKFNRPAKLTKAVLILLIRLFRRYLLVLNLNCLVLRFLNFGDLISFLWRTAIRPLNEVFNHPQFFCLIGDLEFSISSKRFGVNATKIKKNSELSIFLEKQKTQILLLFDILKKKNLQFIAELPGTQRDSSNDTFWDNNNISFFLQHKFESVWLLFCRTFLINCRCVHVDTYLQTQTFYNFLLLINNFQFMVNPKRQNIYRKKFRSIRRRKVKQITKETSQRLWVF